MLDLHAEDAQDPRLSDCIFREDMVFITVMELMKEILGRERYINNWSVYIILARIIAQHKYACDKASPHSYTSETIQKLFENIIIIIRSAKKSYKSMYPSFRKEYTNLGLETMEIWLTEQYISGSHRQKVENLGVWCSHHLAPFLDGMTHPGFYKKLSKELDEALHAITSSEEEWRKEYVHYQKKWKQKT